MAQRYGQLGADDKAGIFIGDGSYLFVPDNKSYDGAKRLLFDEHNHPVSKEEEEKMTPAQRPRGPWHRCYRAVFLLHCNRAAERFVIVGLRVMRADRRRVFRRQERDFGQCRRGRAALEREQ